MSDKNHPQSRSSVIKNEKFLLCAAAFFALTAIILGAFGAHALRAAFDPSQARAFETGVRYQFYHAVGLFIVVLLARTQNTSPSNWLGRAGYGFIAGIVLFSGSLYLLSCRDVLGITEFSAVLGPLTPLGGLCFIGGWVCVLIDGFRR